MQIYLNGRQVFERSGFGPEYIEEYFTCDGKSNDIRAVCDYASDGAVRIKTIIDLLPANTTVYLDGEKYGKGTSDVNIAHITTCKGDTSIMTGKPIAYYKLRAFSNSSTCYP